MLSIYEVAELIAKGELKIIPILNSQKQFQRASFDLRLGSEYIIFKRTNITHLRLEKDKECVEDELNRSAEFITIKKPPERFILHPGEFVLASTLEYIKLPDNIVAEIHGKSSWARLGLVVHGVAGFVDPGFSGTLTLELVNLGKMPIPLYVGVRIAQLTFHKLKYGVPEYLGKYRGCGVKLSKIYEDEEFDKIRLAENTSRKCQECNIIKDLDDELL